MTWVGLEAPGNHLINPSKDTRSFLNLEVERSSLQGMNLIQHSQLVLGNIIIGEGILIPHLLEVFHIQKSILHVTTANPWLTKPRLSKF